MPMNCNLHQSITEPAHRNRDWLQKVADTYSDSSYAVLPVPLLRNLLKAVDTLDILKESMTNVILHNKPMSDDDKFGRANLVEDAEQILEALK